MTTHIDFLTESREKSLEDFCYQLDLRQKRSFMRLDRMLGMINDLDNRIKYLEGEKQSNVVDFNFSNH